MGHQTRPLRERIASAGGWAFAAKIVTSLLTVCLTAIVARIITPSDLGTFFLCFSVITFLSLIARFGLDQVAVRLVSENITIGNFSCVKPIVLKVLLLNSLFLLIISLILLLGAADWLTSSFFKNSLMANIPELLILWLIVITLQLLIPDIFRGFRDFRLASLFQGTTIFGSALTGTVVGSILIFIWICYGAISLPNLIKIIVLAGSSGVLVSCLLLIKKLQTLPAGSSVIPSIELLQIGGPILIINLSMFALMQVDIWVIGALRPEAELALYGAATRIIKLITIPLIVVNEVVAPVIAELNVQSEKQKLERTLRGAASIASVPAILAIILLFMFGGPIMSILFGEFYGQGAFILCILGTGQVVNVWAGSCGYTLIMTGHHKTMMFITVASGVVATLGCIMVAENHGAEGVAAMASLAMIVQNIAMLLSVKIHCQVWTHASPLIAYQELRRLWQHLLRKHSQ